MDKVEVFEKQRPVLGINSYGRIGKRSLWLHVPGVYVFDIRGHPNWSSIY